MSETSSVRLGARQGEPLADDQVRSMVVATAHAVGERQGVEIVDVKADSTGVTITVRGPQLVAIGLAAELRRLTARWYSSKYGQPSLWGEDPDAAADAWKNA